MRAFMNKNRSRPTRRSTNPLAMAQAQKMRSGAGPTRFNQAQMNAMSQAKKAANPQAAAQARLVNKSAQPTKSTRSPTRQISPFRTGGPLRGAQNKANKTDAQILNRARQEGLNALKGGSSAAEARKVAEMQSNAMKYARSQTAKPKAPKPTASTATPPKTPNRQMAKGGMAKKGYAKGGMTKSTGTLKTGIAKCKGGK